MMFEDRGMFLSVNTSSIHTPERNRTPRNLPPPNTIQCWRCRSGDRCSVFFADLVSNGKREIGLRSHRPQRSDFAASAKEALSCGKLLYYRDSSVAILSSLHLKTWAVVCHV
eukprot:1395076-Amphidinium_carterae.1